MKRFASIAGLVLCALWLHVAHAAPVLWINDNNAGLGTVDIASGAVVVIGGSGVLLSDIAFDPSGNLWGISLNTNQLYRVNRTTAALTSVGPLGVGGMNALVFASNGTLYGMSGTSSNLYTINTLTGAATSLGATSFFSAGDLAFHGGNLYLSTTTNQLARIDIANPAASAAVGPIGFSSVFGLATGDDNVLYGVAGTQIFSINTATGVGTLVRNYGGAGLFAANGTAFVTEAGAPPSGPPPPQSEPSEIPTLSEWALIALCFAVLAIGMAARRRRSH